MVVTIIPDGGRPYVSKVFNDSWMREHGYLGDASAAHRRRRDPRQRDAGEPAAAHRRQPRPVGASARADARARRLAGSGGLGRGRPAFIGTVSERGLLMASADHPGILGEPVTEVIEPPLPELAAETRSARPSTCCSASASP